MMTLTIDSEIEQRLEALGAETEAKKTELLKRALLEALEDLEDLRMAEAELSNPGPRYSLDEVEREFGLDG